MIKRISGLVSILILTLLLLGVSLSGGPDWAANALAQENETYGLVAGNIEDRGFNQLAWAGMQQAAEELGVSIDYLETSPENVQQNIKQFVDRGYDGIVTVGFPFARAARTASLANLSTPFVSVDFPSQTAGDLGLLFAANEPAFLAGYLAAGQTKTGTVCTYGGQPGLPVLIFMVGFDNGIRYYNQQKGTDVALLGWQTDPSLPLGGEGVFAGSFDNPEGGRSLAEDFFDQGCDIIFPVAGATGLGSAQVAQARGLTVIGVDADQAVTAPELAEVYLTSVLKRVDVTVFEAVKRIHNGSFNGGKNFIGALANGGVGLAPFHSYESEISPALKEELAKIEQGIISGEIFTGWPIIRTSLSNAGLSPAKLGNATYHGIYPESVTLTGGTYEGKPFVEGGASRPTVTLIPSPISYGDLNGDGQADAAVLLAESSGGSGTFIYLAAVVNQSGQPVNVATTLLGDRVQVNSMIVGQGQIVVDMVQAGPDDPMCCPSQRVIKTYELQDDQLVELSSSAATSAGPELVGTLWQWDQTLMNNGDTFAPENPGNYTIQFMADGSVAIQADCNRVAGSYTVDANAITIQLGPSTLAACPPGSLGDQFVAGLGAAALYAVQDNNLLIDLMMDSGTMQFSPVSTELAGTNWTVISYNNGRGGVVSTLLGTELTATFGEDGNVTGSSGCNSYSAAYEVDGDNISIGPAITTRKACAEPEGVMEQEQEYLAALETAATYQFKGNGLELRTAEGSLAVSFEAAE